MKVATDNNIFLLQKFGGISRLFEDYLESGLIQKKLMIPYNESNYSNRKRIFHNLTNKLGLINKNSLNEYETNILQEYDFDLFHPSYYGEYFLDFIKVPFVITAYDMIYELYPEIFNINDLSIEKNRVFSKASRIIAISNQTKEDVITISGISEDKIDVVPLYTKFDSVNSETVNIELNFSYFLFVGNRNYYKNFKRFALAVLPILKKNKDYKVICTGTDFNQQEINFLEEMGVRDNFKSIICKNDAELKWLYENALCFVFPSLYEGFGFPLLEAFASRCPVLSSSGGALKEVGKDSCIFFNPFDINELTEKLFFIINNPKIRDELRAKGLSRLRKYSLDKTIQLTKESYIKALQ
jgi:glycosyltransferase involved in cell wall biosynthesis